MQENTNDFSVPAERDYAETGSLTALIEGVLPALEKFMLFEGVEKTARQKGQWSALLDEPLPKQGVGAQGVMEILRDVVIPNGVRLGHPGFSGWIGTSTTTVPATTTFASLVSGPGYQGIQAYNLLEALALRWLAQLVGIPGSYQGLFTSGGSVANLVGLGAARQYAAERLGIDAAYQGVAALPKPRIYASKEVHHVVMRAAGILGLGRNALYLLPTDKSMCMDVGELSKQLKRDRLAGYTPVAVIANAGTVNTGAIDPLPQLADFCKNEGIWLHVDGAYGLLGVLDPRIAHLYGDLAAADSLVLDPHKWLAAPIGCGAAFVRDSNLLGRAFTLESAAYIEESQPDYQKDEVITSQFDDFGYVYHHFGVEQSAPARGAQVWSILKEVGEEGIRARVYRHNSFARFLAERVQQAPSLELMAPVTLSICCFRYVPPALQEQRDAKTSELLNQLNRAILARVRARGRCIPSATFVNGNYVIRPCFINPRTTLAEVEALAEEVETCGAALWNEVV
ncbi:aminotransferase class V-fold PLP-dependent enzyme [Ktedonosporobacter rubrisoli]|uniref:Aminotransferase class V-fold PLP-dependent enzyme n=1 Tax=Ktedonosporobacter rubrisoli TaxID=2509675 RepID=A0A4P6K0M6_KTERU|nr:aminotransferase class V-fold PLP-dependent enzyme [Ktedonosporobacter rubrisoli]QBD81525.1 aminotransferase class V-fold PLP-dependent enzyme [Ktedonosporobacter rubrisoli]